MSLVTDAARAVSTTETRIRELIQTAVVERQFDTAKRLIDAIEGLAIVRHALEAGAPDGSTRGLATTYTETALGTASDQVQAASVDSTDTAKKATKAKLPTYPQFERDNDRLIKIGWSIREKKTYEHRIARQAVDDICGFLAEHVKPKRPFKVEQIGPVKSASGAEVPTYQTYLVLKWLQHFGAVERRGNDGYVLGERGASKDIVDQLWTQTTERRSN